MDLVGEVASLLSSTYGPDGGIELSPLAKNSFQQSVLMNLSIRVWSPLLVEAASFSRARFIWVGSMHQLEPRFSPHLELRLIACVGQQDIVSHPTLRRIDLYFRAVLTIVPGGKL